MKLQIEQNTANWQRERLGNFTASAIAKLMGKGRSKDAIFSAAGQTYIYETAYGRMLREDVINDDEQFWAFSQRISKETYATRYGHDTEDAARMEYVRVTGNEINDGAMFRDDNRDHLTASPDGLVGDDGLIEIKCPYGMDNFVRYAIGVHDGEELKAVNADYYWQIQCQLAVTGRAWCDFVTYDPMLNNPIHIAHIERNETDIEAMLAKIDAAEEQVTSIINQLNNF